MIGRSAKRAGLILTLFLISVTACIDPIDFDVPAGLSDSLVMQGRVVKGNPSFFELNISRLFDFSPESRQPVSVRKVVFSDTNNNEMEVETNSPGTYRLVLDETTEIQAEVGMGYMIRVETFDNRIYESTVDVMTPVPDPIGLNVSTKEELVLDPLERFVPEPRILLSIDSEILPNSAGMYWEVNNVFKFTDSPPDTTFVKLKTCYLNKLASVNDIHVLDPELISGNRIEGFELGISPIDFRFYEGLYYEVRQYSLSEGAFRYWNGIDILSEREGNMFDGPVGEVESNLININDPEDFVFGYFFATEEKLIRVRVPQSLVGNPGPFCPPEGPSSAGPGGGCIWGLCCDCLIDESASLERPSYWED